MFNMPVKYDGSTGELKFAPYWYDDTGLYEYKLFVYYGSNYFEYADHLKFQVDELFDV